MLVKDKKKQEELKLWLLLQYKPGSSLKTDSMWLVI